MFYEILIGFSSLKKSSKFKWVCICIMGFFRFTCLNYCIYCITYFWRENHHPLPWESSTTTFRTLAKIDFSNWSEALPTLTVLDVHVPLFSLHRNDETWKWKSHQSFSNYQLANYWRYNMWIKLDLSWEAFYDSSKIAKTRLNKFIT